MRYNAVDTNLCNFTSQIQDVMSHKTPTYRYNFADSSLSRKINKDTLEVSNKNYDNKNDGKISFSEKLKNFGKGLIKPIKTMFSSPKNIAITALSAAGCAGLIALTGGAAAPVLVALGITGGVVQIGKGVYKQVTAKTDEQAKNAWQDIGSGTFTTGVSALAAKSALKANNVNTKGMSTLKAVGKCFKDLRTNTVNSFKKASLSNLKFWKKSTADNTTETAASETKTTEGKPSGSKKGIIRKIYDKIFKKDKSSNNSEVASKADATDAPKADAPKANVSDTSKAKAKQAEGTKTDVAPKTDVKQKAAPKADTKQTKGTTTDVASKTDVKQKAAPKADTKQTKGTTTDAAPKTDAKQKAAPKADTKQTKGTTTDAAPKTDAKAETAPKVDTVKKDKQQVEIFNYLKNGFIKFKKNIKELFEVFGIGIDKVK